MGIYPGWGSVNLARQLCRLDFRSHSSGLTHPSCQAIRTSKPIRFLLVVRKTGSCCRLPLKSTKEDKEEIEEATASLVTAKKTSADDAVTAVLSDLVSIFTLKEEQRFFLVYSMFSLYS